MSEWHVKGTTEFKLLDEKSGELMILKRNKFRNCKKIKQLQNEIITIRSEIKNIYMNPMIEWDRWRKNNPDTFQWVHELSYPQIVLAEKIRSFDLLLGTRNKEKISENILVAKSYLHYSNLSAHERQYLVAHVRNHESHDCRDESQKGTVYWNTQKDLNKITNKNSIINDSITVWRGEKYSTTADDNKFKRNLVIDRIRKLQNLQPGDIFEWDNSVATSLSPEVASSALFTKLLRAKEFTSVNINKIPDDLSYGFIFEIETNRGVYIDKTLVPHMPANEMEILMPGGIKFIVVGSAILSSNSVNTTGLQHMGHHVIKLALAAQGDCKVLNQPNRLKI